MGKLYDFTGTSTESGSLGLIICRILGELNNRIIIDIENYKGEKLCEWTKKEANYKLIIGTSSHKVFSKYINKNFFKYEIRQYFNKLFQYIDYKKFNEHKSHINIWNNNINLHKSIKIVENSENLPF